MDAFHIPSTSPLRLRIIIVRLLFGLSELETLRGAAHLIVPAILEALSVQQLLFVGGVILGYLRLAYFSAVLWRFPCHLFDLTHLISFLLAISEMAVCALLCVGVRVHVADIIGPVVPVFTRLSHLWGNEAIVDVSNHQNTLMIVS
ncbi:hypothetical protein RRF57_007862 [Xylaria bambusicola]|uniref:Uncharacterized protein n=1 Tax=Xylaria bambusicola TaxID=326684 RepID=A0AAN7V127_9PEZI